MKYKAAIVWEKDQPFSIEEADLAPPNADEILVKKTWPGSATPDEVAQTQQIPVPLPAVLGHEGAGIVEEVGSLVTEFQKGIMCCFPTVFAGTVSTACPDGTAFAKISAKSTFRESCTTHHPPEQKRKGSGLLFFAVFLCHPFGCEQVQRCQGRC
jgi:NADPH:quinone reductase-like Zn-dependent oxidoreductase